MRHEVQHWDLIRATLEIVVAGVGQVGLAPTVAIQRMSDGLYLQAGGGSWDVAFAVNALAEVDAVNLAGYYAYSVPLARLDYAAGADGYLMRYDEAVTPVAMHALVEQAHKVAWDEARASYVTAGSFGEGVIVEDAAALLVESLVDDIWDEDISTHTIAQTPGLVLQVAAGLGQFNHRILNPTYDANGRLLTAELKVYPTSADALNDINELAALDVTCTYDADGNLASYLSRE